MRLKIQTEMCCDYCGEIIHNHLDCPVCGEEDSPSSEYGHLCEIADDIDGPYYIQCGSCETVFKTSDYPYDPKTEWEVLQ